MRSAVRKMGNSSGVIIPKPLLSEIGAKAGDTVDIVAIEGKLVISAAKARPRAGWAEDAKRIAEAEDDALVWPEFPNEGDESLIW